MYIKSVEDLNWENMILHLKSNIYSKNILSLQSQWN